MAVFFFYRNVGHVDRFLFRMFFSMVGLYADNAIILVFNIPNESS